MSIIPVSLLQNELPDDANNIHNEITRAVESASGFINTHTSKKYDIWDDYDSSNDTPRAPDIIVAETLRVGKLYYFDIIGDVWRNGEEIVTLNDMLEIHREELKKIMVPPEFKDQTISLDTNSNMLIGSRTTTTGLWTRVIPRKAHITSGGSSVYVINDDFWISKGGEYDDEYPAAWYLRCDSGSTVEGTLSFMRSYRKDSYDYMVY